MYATFDLLCDNVATRSCIALPSVDQAVRQIKVTSVKALNTDIYIYMLTG